MDFIENLNESYDLEYHEIGECESSELILKDIDNDRLYRFYPEDVSKIIKFLNIIRDVTEYEVRTDLNESFNFICEGLGKERVVTLHDVDFDMKFNFYPEDIIKIETFLNRLKDFGIL